jgi:hypothetical protein
MADNYRDQVNTARRAGYTDAEIIDHLKGKDSKVATALDQGYTADEILSHIAPMPTMGEKLTRATGITVGGMAPAAIGAGAGALLGTLGGPAAPITVPAGALIGSVGVPVSDAAIQAYNALAGKNVPMLSQSIKNMLGTPKPETTGERMVDVASSALLPAGIEPAAANLVKGAPVILGGGKIQLPFKDAPITINGAKIQPAAINQLSNAPMLGRAGQVMSQAPLSQLITAPTTGALAQGVTETSGNPLLGLATGVAAGTASNIRAPKRLSAPSAEILGERAKANYDVLDQSNFQLNDAPLNAKFQDIDTRLTNKLAYDPAQEPRVAKAIQRIKANNPKNASELQIIRTFINKARASENASERLIAGELLDEFDDYVLTAPAGGDQKALSAWKSAREDYAKLKKSEIFADIIKDAQVTQGDPGKFMANQISALAKNKSKMRLFTPGEQEEIRKVAEGGAIQGILTTAAKFTPMTPAAAIFTAVNPWGAYTAAGGMAAKALAKTRQERQVNNLSEVMRAGLGGRPPIIENAMRNLPITSYREATNALNLNNQNALAQ